MVFFPVIKRIPEWIEILENQQDELYPECGNIGQIVDLEKQ
jgi:hypothetical protein